MKKTFLRMQAGWRKSALSQTLERNTRLRVSIYILVALVAVLCLIGFFSAAPPNTITITSGPKGSQFERTALKYQAILARSGIKLKILPSEGSLENIQRLTNRKVRVDVGFVQGGMSKDVKTDGLVSLGSVFYEPLMVFYRAKAPVTLLSEFKGHRLVIGPDGSGAHVLGLLLLHLNGIDPGSDTALLESTSDQAAQDLLDGKVEAVFLMGDSANMQVTRKLLHDPGIRLLDFSQADAYARRNVFLSKMQLSRGVIDFGENIPDQDISLIGPTVELVARDGLHPALSDALLDAAREVHGRSSLFQKRGEFPAPLEQEFKISDDAQRYYKSGKTFLYRYMPFWLASLVDRMLVVVVPIIVLLIPGLRILPALYNWRIRQRILRWYGVLLVLERDVNRSDGQFGREELLERLRQVENAVNRLSIPLSFADQFYVLRGHIDFVRGKLLDQAGPVAEGGGEAS